MSAKISIFKTTADGEQVNCELEVTPDILKRMEPKVSKEVGGNGASAIVPGLSLRQIFAPYFQLCDDRLFEMNQRIMASNVLVRKLSPDAQFAIKNVFEVLHGRSQGPAPAEILEEDRRQREAAAKASEVSE